MNTAAASITTSANASVAKLSAVLAAADLGQEFADATARLIVQGFQEESTQTRGGDLWTDVTTGVLQRDPSLSRQQAAEQAWGIVWAMWRAEERAAAKAAR